MLEGFSNIAYTENLNLSYRDLLQSMKSIGDENLTAEKKDAHLNSLWVMK